MKKFGFVRSTHVDGEFVADAPEQERCWHDGHNGFVGHMLCSDKAMSFDEVCQEVSRYAEQYPEDGSYPRTVEIALALVKLIEHGMARVVELEELH